MIQQGLRINNESKEMWEHYLKFELDFISKLSQRQQILKGENICIIKDEKEEKHENNIDGQSN